LAGEYGMHNGQPQGVAYRILAQLHCPAVL